MARKPAKSKILNSKEPLRGSKLEQMWLDGVKGKLHPAEVKLLEACRRGEECIVGEVRPEAVTKDNMVRAGFLRYLILGGCDGVQVHARGVRLKGAWVECRAGTRGVDLEAAKLPRDVFLNGCIINGSINLTGATSCSIGLEGTWLQSVYCNRLTANGSVYFRSGFIAKEIVTFMGASIAGSLYCTGGRFEATGKSLSCDRLETGGGVFLRNGFFAQGLVRLPGAKIGNQLTCSNGKFDGGIECKEATIGTSVYLNGDFNSQGTVNFANATIGGNIHCDKGHFLCKDQAIFANRADIKGDVSFDDAKILGTVALTGTDIGGSLAFNRTRLNGKPSLQLRGSKIAGTLYWRDLKAVDGDIDLGGASCNTVSFGPKSWMRKFEEPKKEVEENHDKEVVKPAKRPSTKLDNFTYNGFNNPPDKADGKFWIEWLKVQPDDHLGKKFRPKPWTQLANVLESMGYEGEAKKVLVEREWMLTRFMARHDPENSKSGFFSFNWARVMWRRIWGVTIDYGYQPLKALFYLTAVILIGFGIFYWASTQGIMAPTHPLVFKEARLGGSIDKVCAQNWVWLEGNCIGQMPSEYSEFASFFYSADVALPIINLRQQEDWSPRVVDHNGNRIWTGYFVRLWEWFATVIGWVLSLMFVSAVGGFIRR